MSFRISFRKWSKNVRLKRQLVLTAETSTDAEEEVKGRAVGLHVTVLKITALILQKSGGHFLIVKYLKIRHSLAKSGIYPKRIIKYIHEIGIGHPDTENWSWRLILHIEQTWLAESFNFIATVWKCTPWRQTEPSLEFETWRRIQVPAWRRSKFTAWRHALSHILEAHIYGLETRTHFTSWGHSQDGNIHRS